MEDLGSKLAVKMEMSPILIVLYLIESHDFSSAKIWIHSSHVFRIRKKLIESKILGCSYW